MSAQNKMRRRWPRGASEEASLHRDARLLTAPGGKARAKLGQLWFDVGLTLPMCGHCFGATQLKSVVLRRLVASTARARPISAAFGLSSHHAQHRPNMAELGQAAQTLERNANFAQQWPKMSQIREIWPKLPPNWRSWPHSAHIWSDLAEFDAILGSPCNVSATLGRRGTLARRLVLWIYKVCKFTPSFRQRTRWVSLGRSDAEPSSGAGLSRGRGKLGPDV